MDKIKDIGFLLFVKHLFWALSLIIVVLGVVFWFMSAGRLKGQYDDHVRELTGKWDEVKRIGSKAPRDIFNQTSHDGMEEQIERRRKEVFLAWQQKYEKQRDVLQWPKALWEVRDAIRQETGGVPIEQLKIEPGQRDPLIALHREHYRNTIKEALPQLAEMIRANWKPSATTRDTGRLGGIFSGRESSPKSPPRGSETGGEETPEKEYVVDWDSGNQTQIQSSHFDWPHADRGLPSTVEILYAMEDYWVLKALMQIIRRTNTDEETGQHADAPHKATIRKIYFIDIGIDIGRSGRASAGSVFKLAGEATDRGEGETASQGQPPPPADTGEGLGARGSGAVLLENDPADGRYVKKDYTPLPAATLRSAAESDNKEEAYLAVAKRMPVRMRVRMDQRKLNKFLIECGNSDLMLEVKQVRVNPDGDSVFGGTRRTSSAPRGGGSAFSRNPSPEASNRDNRKVTEFPWDVDVEIYGIIYIFNPPSLKRLGIDEEQVAKFTAATAPAEGAGEQKPADGAPADGAPADGAPADGAPADAAPADAALPADAEPGDEKPPADGEEKPPVEAARGEETPEAVPAAG